MHHGNEIDPETLKKIEEQIGKKLGATGEFPLGKLRGDDEGALRFLVRAQDGRVVIEWGKSAAWVGMTPEQACELAVTLIKESLFASGEATSERG